MKRPGRGDATRLKAWPNHNHGDPPMVEAASRVSHGSTRYWVDVILTTAWECRRFDREREALACEQVYARLPNAEAVVAKGGRSSSIGVKQNTAIPPTRGPTDDATEKPERPHLRGNVHYIPTEFETRLRMLVAWEARQRARQEVIRRLNAEGKVRVSLMSRAEITQLANEHLRRNATERRSARALCRT
jgi:hypothetical protein